MLIRHWLRLDPEGLSDGEFWERHAEALWMERRYRTQMMVAVNDAIAAAFGGG